MRYSIGIDEVGRGCLAGPVVVCAVRMPREWRPPRGRALRDSKRLTKSTREAWFEYVTNHRRISYVLSRISPAVIDRINIARAANIAALRAWKRLVTKGLVTRNQELRHDTKVFLDGGLYLGNGRARLPGETVVRGDEKITAVKISSIIAKVSRDRLMARLARKFPQYGFEIHKGYGTHAHYAALRAIGASAAHRKTFIRSVVFLAGWRARKRFFK